MDCCGISTKKPSTVTRAQKSTFCGLITKAQSIIGTEKYTDAGIILNYLDDDYSQGYGQVAEAFRCLTKMISFFFLTSEHNFTSCKAADEGNEVG